MNPDQAAPVSDSAVHWYAIHTRSNHERKVRAALSALDLEVYLPEFRTWSTRRDRRRRIERPLFPGYLFVHTALVSQTRLAIIRAPSVVRIVGAGPQPTPIPADEVESIRLLLGAVPDAAPGDRLMAGQKVQVMDGPLQGVVGRVLESRKGRRIVVTVELLGRSVAADLPGGDLEPYLD